MPAKPAPTENLLALPDGTELVGDYRIKRVLGAGGFGITYLADEKALARLVTIKEYFPADFAARRATNASPRSQEVAGDYQWGLDRFIEEAQTLARFDHPNVVRVHRYFRANNTAYMVLHFEEGGSFKSWLRGLKRAPRQAELDTMVAPLLDALEIIHKANFLHRDIAPDNIMVRRDGSPVLIDFGSARGQIASHSRTVSALVKPGYSPYEQYATTTSSQGPWTDIYALGATLYHAITGKRPPDAPSRMLSDEYVAAGEAALSSYRSGFLRAIDKALRLEVGERPQSIAEWRGDLLAPDPKRAPGRLGLRLPIARTLGRLSSAVAPALAKGASAAPPEATVALTEQSPSLIPAPPDAPQPKGQLLDFIDALKKHRPPLLTPKKKNQAAVKPPREPVATPSGPRQPAVAQADSDAQFGLGYGPPPEPAPPPAIAPASPKKSTPPPRRAPRVLQRAAAKRRAPPRPRRVWRMPSRRWRAAIFKVGVAVAIASLAVAYQESCAPHAGPRRRDGRQPDRRSCANDAARRAQGPGRGGRQQRSGPLDRLGGHRCHDQGLERRLGRAGAHDRTRRRRADRARRRQPARAGRAQGRHHRSLGSREGRKDRHVSARQHRRRHIARIHGRRQRVCRGVAGWQCCPVRYAHALGACPCCSTAATAPA